MGKETIGSYFRILCKDMTEIYGPTFMDSKTTRTELDGVARECAATAFIRCIGTVDPIKMN